MNKVFIRITFYLLTTFLQINYITSLSAQDANYWTNQYGTRANLLGGAVIGSVLELSGAYYNPGGLSLIEDPELILAAKVFQYPTITLRGAGYQDVKLNSSRIDPAPSMLAGLVKFKWLGKNTLGYSIFTRHEVKFDLSGTEIISLDLYPSIPGDEVNVGTLRVTERLSEPWWGITWASRFMKKIGYGISTYALFRSHRATIQSSSEVITNDGEIYILNGSRDYKYSNYRLLAKLGFTFDFIGLTMGLTVTMPSIELYGSGEAGINITYIGPDTTGDGKQETWAAVDYQDGVGSDYKTPLSIGIGTTLKFKKRTNIYFSAEWFNSIQKYDVIKTEDFLAQISGDTLSSKVTSESQQVLNMGIGIEHHFNKNISGIASFSTDYSSKKPDTDTNLSITSWDIFNVLAGASVIIKKTELTFGIGYSFGSDKFDFSTDSPISDLINQIPLIPDKVDFSYTNWKLVFGFSF
jgi:hypothetical protein